MNANGLQKAVPEALESVSLQTIRKQFEHVARSIYAGISTTLKLSGEVGYAEIHVASEDQRLSTEFARCKRSVCKSHV